MGVNLGGIFTGMRGLLDNYSQCSKVIHGN